MNVEADYFGEKDFLSLCNKDKNIQRILMIKGQRSVTKVFLSEYNINPDKNGFYDRTQKNKFYNVISEGGKLVYKKKEINKIDGEKRLKVLREFNNFFKNNYIDSQLTRGFLRFIISQNIHLLILRIRKECGIPEGGFENRKEFTRWVMVNKEINTESRYVEENGISVFILETFYKGHKKLVDKIGSIFNRYGVDVNELLQLQYIVFGFNDREALFRLINKESHKSSMIVSTHKTCFTLESNGWHNLTEEISKIYKGGISKINYTHNQDNLHLDFEFKSPVFSKKVFDSFFKKYHKQIRNDVIDFFKVKQDKAQVFVSHWFVYFSHNFLKISLKDINDNYSSNIGFLKLKTSNWKEIKKKFKVFKIQERGGN